MKQKFISIIAVILALTSLSGCTENAPLTSGQDSTVNSTSGEGSDNSSTNSSSSSTKDPVQSSSEHTESSSPEESSIPAPIEVSSSASVDIPPVELTADNMLTSIKLFDVISRDKDNSMFSPLSLNMALGLLAEGAGGGSKTALDTYLGTDKYSDFVDGYMQIVESQYNYESDYDTDWKNVFEIANSFWANKSIPFNEDYKNRLSEKFKAEVRNIDFGDKTNALGEINGWVSDKTHKMIPTIINDYSDDIAAVLINTIYFESAWRTSWTINEDDKQPFTLPDGSTKDIPLMRNSVRSYFENDKATAFSCGYLNGLEFIGILPKETGDFTIESLDIPSLLESESYEFDVYAGMPRLNFETEIPLTETLNAFGLSEIFDENAADFYGISQVALHVSDILQKTKLELDENGTKAAAVTAILIEDTSAMPVEREKKSVTLDRPFAFMIYDSAEDQIIFLGKVTDPQ
ncbi:MAG: serpin family protein [Ruminococcaceae bacterium]|nr:serpin family protein [Oscillospiraceae bacterium]